MIAETPLLQTKYNQLLSRNWQKHFSYKLNIIKSVSTPRHNVMTVLQRVCSECSDDNRNVPSVIWLLSAEYCQCQQSSGAPATEHDPRQPWNHPEFGASLQTYQGFSEENLDTKIPRVQLCFLWTIPPIHCLTSRAVVEWSLGTVTT